MKIFLTQILILTMFAMCAAASDLKGQEILERKISLKADRKEIREVLSEIEKQAHTRFTYSSAVVNVSRVVSVHFNNTHLSEVLNNIFGAAIAYEVRGNRIILKPGPPVKAIQSNNTLTESSFAIEVSGKVTDENGQRLPGVSVLEKGTTNGTSTDAEGNFRLSVTNSSSILTISFIGYATQEVTVGPQTTFNISLQPDVYALDEVVVIGYGTVKKSDLTGAVSSVKSKDISAYPAIDAVQSIQGRVAGVNVSATNGEPGSSPKIRIRGGTSINASNYPLIVVDGFIGGSMPPPEDIESMEILKDASSTAIYGSRGANGVIMVTTKKGKAGKAQINFNTSYSIQHEINRFDLLNADQFTSYIREAQPDYTPSGSNTDWQDQIFRTGAVQNHQLSVSGGTDNVSYYVSGTYFDQKGIILNSGFNRLSLTNNINIKASDKLNVGVNLLIRRSVSDGVKTQEWSGGVTPGVIASAFKFGPDQGIYNPDGTFTRSRLGDPYENPYAIATQAQQQQITDWLQGSVFAEYELLKGLKFRTSFGATTTNWRAGAYSPTTITAGRSVGGLASMDAGKSTVVLTENYFTYNKNVGETSNLSAVLGYSYQGGSDESWGTSSQGFITNSTSYWNMGSASTYNQPYSALTKWKLVSYYGRLNYNLKDRYLVTASARYDGSSNLSKPWDFFPSGAIAWNMKNESFMEDFQPVSLWKWRVSYGLVGNQSVSPYGTLAALSPLPYTVIGGQIVNALYPSSVANASLGWEKTKSLNIGLDIGLLNDRVTLTAEYYDLKTSGLLFSKPLPQYTGYPSMLQNIGKVGNHGIELTLTTRNIDSDNLKWDMTTNLSANRNKVLELPEGNDIEYSSSPGHMKIAENTQILREGYPVGSFFGYVYDGVYQQGDTFIPGGGFEQQAGGEKFRDIGQWNTTTWKVENKPDGALDDADRTVIGNPQPKFIWGWNNDFKYKNFDLNIFFQGSQGNDILSYSLMELNLLNAGNNATTEALDRWTPEHTNTDVPMVNSGRAPRVSTRWVFDGSYARLKNLALGYTLPASALIKTGISRLRVYVSAQNVLTLTKYKGYDPEVNYSSSNTNVGLDYGSYPNAKSYTVGLNVGF